MLGQEKETLSLVVRNLKLGYFSINGLTLAFRLVKLCKNPSSLKSLSRILSEQHFIVRVSAVRWALFLAGFPAFFVTLRRALHAFAPKLGDHGRIAAAGAVAGLTVSVLEPETRHTVALYTMTRAVQCVYNWCKQTGRWHCWGTSWRHGDALLFQASCAQCVYSYVLHPYALPESYYRFLVSCAPIAEETLRAVRAKLLGTPVDYDAVNRQILSRGGRAHTWPCAIIDCARMHPQEPSCRWNVLRTFRYTFRQTVGFYLGLHLLPSLVTKIDAWLRNPVAAIGTATFGGVRSATFIATLIGCYQMIVCLHRRVATKEQASLFWISAFISSASILIEEKRRRSELALYVFPRAVASVWTLLLRRGLVPRVPAGNTLLFSASVAVMMLFYFHDLEKKTSSTTTAAAAATTTTAAAAAATTTTAAAAAAATTTTAATTADQAATGPHRDATTKPRQKAAHAMPSAFFSVISFLFGHALVE